MEELQENEELDAYIDSLITAEYVKLIEDDIGLCTCQLFKNDLTKGVVPFASGVFVFLGDEFYLLTASHVIEDWSDSNHLFVKIKDDYVSIVGKGYGTEMEKDEKIDAAYIKLKPQLVSLLVQSYRFLPYHRFLFHEKIFHESSYCAFGYPVINKRKESSDIKTFGSAYYMLPSQDKVFQYYSLNPFTHYVLEFLGKAINIKTEKLEKIKTEHYGLSGGGLWYIIIDFNKDKNEIVSESFLIGIMTEFRRGKYDCLIANRIEIILKMIQDNEGADFNN